MTGFLETVFGDPLWSAVVKVTVAFVFLVVVVLPDHLAGLTPAG